MWGLEHMAFAYLVIRPFYEIKCRKIAPELLIMIFAFANLPDALHIGRGHANGPSAGLLSL